MKIVSDLLIGLLILVAAFTLAGAVGIGAVAFLSGTQQSSLLGPLTVYQVGMYLGILSIASSVLAFGLHGIIRRTEEPSEDDTTA